MLLKSFLLTVVVVIVRSQLSVYLTFLSFKIVIHGIWDPMDITRQTIAIHQPINEQLFIRCWSLSLLVVDSIWLHSYSVQGESFFLMQLNWGHLFYPDVSSRLMHGHILLKCRLIYIHLYNIQHWILDVLNGTKGGRWWVDWRPLLTHNHLLRQQRISDWINKRTKKQTHQ